MNIDKLIRMILESNLPDTHKKWIACYLRGREQRTSFKESTSKSAKLRTGVPQGSVTSPILFAWCLRDFPTPPENITVVMYADDITLLCSNRDINQANKALNEYLEIIAPYLREKQLFVSSSKCSATLFSTWNKEWSRELSIKIEDDDVPTTSSVKLLGVTLDHSLCYSEHIKTVNKKAKKANNALRAITTPKMGLQKKELITIYKATTRSLFSYAAPSTNQISPTPTGTPLKSLKIALSEQLQAALE